MGAAVGGASGGMTGAIVYHHFTLLFIEKQVHESTNPHLFVQLAEPLNSDVVRRTGIFIEN